ncbi:MAG: TlpA family protein disulfide reductase [Cellvibrionaceae bacterium]|nr:TlpA family protein disulfide reductase [Cellvibrionaceae bacterium]
MRKRVIGLLFASIFSLLASPGRAADGVGDLAPNWILPDLNGKPVSLYEEAEAGKTTVMFFWASWCKTCKKLLPVLKELDRNKGDRPISIYLMNVWEDNDPAAFLRSFDVTLPVLPLAENVAQRYEIRITPGIVVVDPERRIRYVHDPEESFSDITAALHRVLGIPQAEAPASVSSEVPEL